MIDLYTWPTPNGHKVHIALEEMALPYTVIPVNINQGDQFKPDFLAISPNNKMPAIVDQDGPGGKPLPLFESGAILLYLADKVGRFCPQDKVGHFVCLEWLMFQMGGLGPMLGQAHHFRGYAPDKIPYAIDRYTNEAGRLYNVMNRRLGEVPYLAGDYSIADMACFPWARMIERQGHSFDAFPNVKRWFEAINARPAVQRGLQVLAEHTTNYAAPMDPVRREMLFGRTQYEKR
jgi:GST-like protein